jgi:hypothetical protein
LKNTLELIDELFSYNEPSPQAVIDMNTIRTDLRKLSIQLLQATGPSSHTTVAIRKIQEAMMACNVALVNGRHDVPTPPEIQS